MQKKKPKEGLRRFVATVHEQFSGTYEIEAEDIAEAKKVIDDSIPDDYCPSQDGSGYRREIYIDPD